MKIVGIDMGTTTISMVMLDPEAGKVLCSRTVAHHAFHSCEEPYAKRQDPELLLRIVLEQLRGMIAEAGVPDGIAMTGQMHGMLYINADGIAVSPLYTWQEGCGNLLRADGKTAAAALAETAGGAAASGFGLTTHYYLTGTGEIPADAVGMVTIPDYIAMRLCGLREGFIASDMAASWGCWDLEHGRFLLDGLHAAGVSTDFLPEVRSDHSSIGTLMLDGLPEGIPVFPALGDNQASVLGSVTDILDTVLINIGTGSQISVGCREFYGLSGSVELRPCEDSGYIMVGSGLCGGRAYAMLEKFYRQVSENNDSMYGKMQQQAAEFLASGGRPWQVRTTFSGTRSNPEERGSMTGIGIDNFTPGAMTVGVMQGMLSELLELYGTMKRIIGRAPGHLVGSGNGIRRNPLLQRFAEELTGMPMKIPAWEEEAACGAALKAAEYLTGNGRRSIPYLQHS